MTIAPTYPVFASQTKYGNDFSSDRRVSSMLTTQYNVFEEQNSLLLGTQYGRSTAGIHKI